MTIAQNINILVYMFRLYADLCIQFKSSQKKVYITGIGELFY